MIEGTLLILALVLSRFATARFVLLTTLQQSADPEQNFAAWQTLVTNRFVEAIDEIVVVHEPSVATDELMRFLQRESPCLGTTHCPPISMAPLARTHKDKLDFSESRNYFFVDLFRFANGRFARGTELVVSSPDISFDASLGYLPADTFAAEYRGGLRTLVTLSRYNERCPGVVCDNAYCADSLCENADGSSVDTFIVRVPVPDSLYNRLQFPIGVIGSENRVMMAFSEQNYEVVNPCLTVVSVHKHCQRNLTAYLNGPRLPGAWFHATPSHVNDNVWSEYEQRKALARNSNAEQVVVIPISDQDANRIYSLVKSWPSLGNPESAVTHTHSIDVVLAYKFTSRFMRHSTRHFMQRMAGTLRSHLGDNAVHVVHLGLPMTPAEQRNEADSVAVMTALFDRKHWYNALSTAYRRMAVVDDYVSDELLHELSTASPIWVRSCDNHARVYRLDEPKLQWRIQYSLLASTDLCAEDTTLFRDCYDEFNRVNPLPPEFVE